MDTVQTNSVNNRIRKETLEGQLIVDEIRLSDFQKKGTKTAIIKQKNIVKSFYPSAQVANSLQDNIFQAKEFGFEEQEFSTPETRVAFLNVPENLTIADVQKRLDETPNKKLIRILSSKPIIADSEQYAIDSLDPILVNVTLDTFANKQAARYPAKNQDGTNHSQAGQLILDINGKVQYRRVVFSTKENASDMDLRTVDTTDTYLSPQMQAELSNTFVVPNQEL